MTKYLSKKAQTPQTLVHYSIYLLARIQMYVCQMFQIKMSSIHMYSGQPKFSLNPIRLYMVKCYVRGIYFFKYSARKIWQCVPSPYLQKRCVLGSTQIQKPQSLKFLENQNDEAMLNGDIENIHACSSGKLPQNRKDLIKSFLSIFVKSSWYYLSGKMQFYFNFSIFLILKLSISK